MLDLYRAKSLLLSRLSVWHPDHHISIFIKVPAQKGSTTPAWNFEECPDKQAKTNEEACLGHPNRQSLDCARDADDMVYDEVERLTFVSCEQGLINSITSSVQTTTCWLQEYPQESMQRLECCRLCFPAIM